MTTTEATSITVEFVDGDHHDYTIAGYPWEYRDWFCISPVGDETLYIPLRNVRSWQLIP